MQALRPRRLLPTAGVVALAAAALFLVAPALADWNVGNASIMHYPQLPDPNGWDVNDTFPMLLADDWFATTNGPVDDVHIWFSTFTDNPFAITNVHISIHADVPAGVSNSHPGAVLWQWDFIPSQFTVRPWSTGVQGWLDPVSGTPQPGNHTNTWQLNINNIGLITSPFLESSGVVYWLDVQLMTQGGPLGWKSSGSPHFGDDAVWWNPSIQNWVPLVIPFTSQSMDLAFVITPEPSTIALVVLGVGGLLMGRRVVKLRK